MKRRSIKIIRLNRYKESETHQIYVARNIPKFFKQTA